MSRTSSRPVPRQILSAFFELLGSMRFAVSLLGILCVASIVGTVLPQNSPDSAYIDQFGPFWFEVFDHFSLWRVYNSGWFLVIMAFLVVSTSICLTRNAPRMLRDARSFREYVRADSLRAFAHRFETRCAMAPEPAAQALSRLFKSQGYAVRVRRDAAGLMVAAKKGSVNRLGYICAHSALIIICLGGLVDSDMSLRLQMWLGGKQPVVGNMMIADVPASGRLSPRNPSFRGNILVPEGGQTSSAVVMVGDGALVQPLPFTLRLKHFVVDYYSTGMPSRFASQVEVTDPATGKRFPATIEVNHPLHYKGITVYQSSFDDGGSQVTLAAYPLKGVLARGATVQGTIGKSLTVDPAAAGAAVAQQGGHAPSDTLHMDLAALRVINVENMSSGAPVDHKSLEQELASVTGSAAGKKNENLHNIGPSIEYRLTDAAGQAHRFRNYMAPVTLDGASVFLVGVQGNDGAYRYVRIPADTQGSLAEFARLRAALADPDMRRAAAQRFAAASTSSPVDTSALQAAAQHALDTFAVGGLQGVADLLQANTPSDQMRHAADMVVRLIGASMAELNDLARQRDGLPAAPRTDAQARWTRLAVAALSDLAHYPAPVIYELDDFNQVQASVFQITRSPGEYGVVLGALLLIVGIFTMFYLRDRRIWAWVQPADGGATVLAAMTTQRRTLDFDQEFERLRAAATTLDAAPRAH
ncbi:MAG: cytochrome c biogenesis protein ResB [Bordetella sp.]|uniref:cytochrome c biogenesis protein ResB n=1 Tax=Bordetella sp. TaxID=28081 RepID=UPI003F7C1E4B